LWSDEHYIEKKGWVLHFWQVMGSSSEVLLGQWLWWEQLYGLKIVNTFKNYIHCLNMLCA
jgi:hypothetical protein